jgi:diaminopimelate decarboxylase
LLLVTDGGLHHHLAASGNFGQVIRKNYPVAVGQSSARREREIVSVVGPLCTPSICSRPHGDGERRGRET